MELAKMDPTSTRFLQRASAPAQTRASAPSFFTLAGVRLQAFWRTLIGRAGIRRQRRTLAVCETATLGDRRFVSVVQFERQRFLIGSSPTAVTLLAQLPDEVASSGENGKADGEKN